MSDQPKDEKEGKKVKSANRTGRFHSWDIEEYDTIFLGPLARYKRCLLVLTSIQSEEAEEEPSVDAPEREREK